MESELDLCTCKVVGLTKVTPVTWEAGKGRITASGIHRQEKILPFKQSFNGDIFLEQEYDSSVKLCRSRVARRFQTDSETLVRHNLQNLS